MKKIGLSQYDLAYISVVSVRNFGVFFITVYFLRNFAPPLPSPVSILLLFFVVKSTLGSFIRVIDLHGKKLRVVENRIEQRFAAHIVQCCQQYCSALLHPIAGGIQAQQLVQYC